MVLVFTFVINMRTQKFYTLVFFFWNSSMSPENGYQMKDNNC